MDKKIEHGQLKLKELQESKTNPRKHFDPAEMKDLTASVKEKGVIVSLVVRPIEGNGHYEIIAGARRFRAAQAADLDEVPCTIRRDLDDKAVCEIQLIENLQRAEVHPLDEAEGYLCLHKKHGLSADELAAKVGKSKAYIYARMKLADLSKPAKELFWEGKLNPSTALLVARIGDHGLQEKAAKEISKPRYGGDGDPMSYRDALEHIQRNYMLRLADADFDTKDADLCPKAGSCLTCPKRTGNQPALFADVKGADVCTDPTCFKEKTEAAWKLKTAVAEAKGVEVLAKPVQGFGNPRGYVRLDHEEYIGGKYTTPRKALGKDCPPVTLARTENGDVIELAKDAEVSAALKKKGLKTGHSSSSHRSSGSSAAAADNKKRQAKGIAHARAVEFLLDHKDFEKALEDLLPIVVLRDLAYILDDVDSESGFWKRTGVKEGRSHEVAEKFSGKPLGEVLRIRAAAELYSDADRARYGGMGDKDSMLSRACRRFKVDLAKLTAEALKALKAPKAKPKGMISGTLRFAEGVKCSACGSPKGIEKYSKSEGVFCSSCKSRVCGKCGCTEDKACPGGCSWAKDGDQCSVCAEKAPAAAKPSAAKKAKPAKKGGRS